MAHYRKQMVSILLTGRCNMKCTYCITSCNYIDRSDINLEFAKQGMRDYFKTTKFPYVRFVALGEPTENFGALKELHEFALGETEGKAQFELQTNGIFSEEKATWIADNIETVWISFDGLPDVHDALKKTLGDKPTSQIILDNLSRLQKKTFAGFRSTITKLNVKRQEEIVRFAKAHQVPAVFTKVMLPPSNPADQHTFHRLEKELKVSMSEYAEEFVKAWKVSREIGVFYSNGYINNSDEMCVYACRTCLPCPHLTTDGYVSACDRATRGDTPLQEFIYGKWNAELKKIEYDDNKIKRLQERSVENMPACSDCEIKYFCAGGCLGTCAQLTGTMFQPDQEYCDAIRYMCKNIQRDPREGLFPYFMT